MRKCLIIGFILYFLTLPVFAGEGSFSVIYLPADDRPLNDQHMRLFAEGLGVELIMPERRLYARNGSDDRGRLLSWLEEQQGDAYVISLDQLLSGGLLESREITETQPIILPGGERLTESEVIDRLRELTAGKRVWFLDSLLRLASNVHCEEDLPMYRTTLDYGRGEACGSLPDTYLAVRRRKLGLNLYAARILPGYLLGVDDSWAGTTIQTGELEALREYVPEKRIFSTFDGLPRAALAKLFLEEAGITPGVKVRYFGNKTLVPTHNFQSAEEMTEQALRFFGVKTGEDLEILILTESDQGEMAVAAAKENQIRQIPTIFVNLCPRDEDFERAFMTLAPGRLLAYSGYGSSVNSLHLGLSMGLARYAGLRMGLSRETAWLELLATLFSDEFGYAAILPEVEKKAEELGLDRYDFRQRYTALERFTLEAMKEQTAPMLSALTQGGLLTSIAPYVVTPTEPIALAGGYFPWHRCFEYHTVFSLTGKPEWCDGE